MKKLFLLLFSVLAFTSQVRADVEWTIWKGNVSFDTDNGGTTNINTESGCISIQVGDILTFTVDDDLEAYDYHQKFLQVKSATSGWDNPTTIVSWENFTDDEKSAHAYTQVVDATIYQEIVTNNGEFNVGGKGYTLKKVTAKRSLNSCIKTSLAELTGNGSFNGSNLNNAVAGDYIYVEATVATGKGYGQYKLEGNGVSTPMYKVYDNLLLTLTGNQITKWTTGGTWPYSTLENLSGANIFLIHPVNSFKIGSIEMATFSANQEVKVPGDDLKAYKATVSDYNVTLTQFTNNVIPANKGAIIVGPQGSVVEFEASSTGSTEKSDLLPVTEDTNVNNLAESGYDLYVLYAGTGEKEDELALSNLLSGISNWGGNVDVSTEEPYTAEWKNTSTSSAMGKWLGGDWSSYDKLRLVFTSNTVTDGVHFGISYSDHAGEDTGADLATGELTVDIPLNASYKSAIENFSFNSNATSGSLTFESAALIDNDGATVAEFRKTISGTIAANKAYLKIDGSGNPGSSKLNIVFAEDENKQEEEPQGETTSIRNMTNTNVNNNVVYNMNGQRVGSDYKGLVIVNGKKIIKK